MGGEFAGVQLPENFDNVQVEGAEQPVQDLAPDSGAKEASQTQATDIVDLDKLERFRFDGRDLTPKEIRNMTMMRSDYTKKTQEVAEARKYADNFAADLEFVLGDPTNRLEQMRGVYPAHYVKIAEQAISRLTPSQVAQVKSATNTQELPAPLKDALSRIENWEKQVAEQTQGAMLTTLDGLHTKLSTQYPYAAPEVVDTRLMLAIEKGLNITKDNVGEMFEKAYKQHNQEIQDRFNASRKNKVEEQVKAGKAARETGSGGSIPGQAPKKYKSIKEAAKDLDAFLSK